MCGGSGKDIDLEAGIYKGVDDGWSKVAGALVRSVCGSGAMQLSALTPWTATLLIDIAIVVVMREVVL